MTVTRVVAGGEDLEDDDEDDGGDDDDDGGDDGRDQDDDDDDDDDEEGNKDDDKRQAVTRALLLRSFSHAVTRTMKASAWKSCACLHGRDRVVEGVHFERVVLLRHDGLALGGGALWVLDALRGVGGA